MRTLLVGRRRRCRLTRSIWLPRRLFEEMEREAVRHSPDETGGMLLGYVRSGGRQRDFVIAGSVPAGPKAEHKPHRFVPDGDWQQAHLERAYHDSGRVISYLGDWHSHPGGGLQPSPIDRRTSARVAASDGARAPVPVCLILGLRRGLFDARAYTFERRRFRSALLLMND